MRQVFLTCYHLQFENVSGAGLNLGKGDLFTMFLRKITTHNRFLPHVSGSAGRAKQ